MRLSTVCLLTTLLACVSAGAQESFPATHLARLDILEPDPDAGTIGGVAIIAVDPAHGIAQIRVTAAPSGDAADSLFLLYRPAGGSDVTLTAIPFPAGSPTLTTSVPIFTPVVMAAVDSGSVRMAVHRRSDHTRYAEGPVQSILSAVAPEPSGSEVVPPADGADGVGHCGLTYDPTANSFRYSAWWLDLSGPAIEVRIRRAPAGSNGPVVFEMPLTPGSDRAIGTWQNPSAELRDALRNGELYFEVTTYDFPHGELRGQIYPVEGFTAAIEPGNEVPPVTGATTSGSAYLLITAHGTREVFNKLQGVIGSLTGPMSAAHIHRGAIGEGGFPVITLDRPSPTTIDLELASGSAGGAMSDEIVADIRATHTYVNVHTAAHQDGEARGQLIPARTNLVNGSTVSVPGGAVGGDDFTARYDRGSGMIVVTIDTSHGARSMDLHAADGRLVRTLMCEGVRCEMSATGLPAGIYFARLHEDAGRIVGGCTVMVVP